MKTSGILAVVFITIIFSGCKYKNEALELQKQNQYLTTQLAKSDSLSNVYRSTLKEIESVFDKFIPEDALDPTPAGRKLSTRLTNKLDEMNDVILEKEKNYKALNNRLINLSKMVSEMSSKIEELNSVIREKDSINVSLKQTIQKLENQIAEQSSQIELHILEIQKLSEALELKTNSAYFIAGSEDELIDKSIIEKTGGFLGLLGRVNTLNPELDKNDLQMIDIRERTTFKLDVEKKHVELITNHPSSSFNLKESSTGNCTLIIEDPAEFWSNSKYLVITY